LGLCPVKFVFVIVTLSLFNDSDAMNVSIFIELIIMLDRLLNNNNNNNDN